MVIVYPGGEVDVVSRWGKTLRDDDHKLFGGL